MFMIKISKKTILHLSNTIAKIVISIEIQLFTSFIDYVFFTFFRYFLIYFLFLTGSGLFKAA